MSRTIFKYLPSRRKWARRGRALADFTLGAFIAMVEHIAAVFLAIIKHGISWIVAVVSKIRSKPSEKDFVRPLPLAINNNMTNQFEPLRGAKPGVRFSDIAGLDEAKREVNLRMILPFRYPERAARYGIRRGGGLLLYDPPGTGKTMLAKAIATELDAAFFHIRPSDILSGQVGQAETNVALLFETLRREKMAVLFIDEIEALVPSRRKNGSTIMQRVISQMLGEVDGLAPKDNEHTLLFIGATNEFGMIDPAMLRPGRFDTKILVGPPDATARVKLFEAALRGKPIGRNMDLPKLVTQTDGMTGAEIVELVNRAADKAFLLDITEGDRQTLTSIDFQQICKSMTQLGG